MSTLSPLSLIIFSPTSSRTSIFTKELLKFFLTTPFILWNNESCVSLIAEKIWLSFVFICFALNMFFLPISSFPEGSKKFNSRNLMQVSLCQSKDYFANKQTNNKDLVLNRALKFFTAQQPVIQIEFHPVELKSSYSQKAEFQC